MVTPLEMVLRRKWFTEESTGGILYIAGEQFCYTLEDRVRPAGEKVPGRTAIPWGTYPVVITFSNRFQKPLPLLVGVPDFSGVRIHGGNRPEDTEGCILVGMSQPKDNFMGSSQLALARLMDRLDAAYEINQPVTLAIAAEAT